MRKSSATLSSAFCMAANVAPVSERDCESTRFIRALDHPRAKTVPIIAMTANVFREDIDRCLAAGMNGHIGKPLNFNEITSVLKEYLP